MGPRVRGQPQERLPRHEARHSRDAEAGRRLDHQHLVDRLDPASRDFLRHLWRLKGCDEPDDANHRRAIRARPCPRELRPAGPDEDADGAHSAGLAASYSAGDVEAMWRARDAQVPMGHMGDAWDVANAALFLASDESRYVTG